MTNQVRLKTIGGGLNEDARIEAGLLGEQLYGDDFSPAEIEAWFRDEAEGYFNLERGREARREYEYFALNQEHGFRFLPERTFSAVLGVGSAFGEELTPIAGRSERIVILEPADGFVVPEVGGVPVSYVKPQPGGELPFPGGSFDLITCFNVLHHIPNVSVVVKEFHRCLKPDGYALINEPVVSMGDWRLPRRGLTKRERGIPLAIFRQIIADAGLEVARERRCMFALTSRLRYLQKKPVYNTRWAVRLDSLLCHLPIWPRRYHPVRAWNKLRPTAVFYVLRKPGSLAP